MLLWVEKMSELQIWIIKNEALKIHAMQASATHFVHVVV